MDFFFLFHNILKRLSEYVAGWKLIECHYEAIRL